MTSNQINKKYSKNWCWFLLFTLVSCNIDFNNEKERMIKDLSKIYVIDKGSNEYQDLKNIGIKELELILSKNGTYRFSPQYSMLNGYEGRWDISDDDEFSSFVFKFENGKNEINRTLFIDFAYKNRNYRLNFKDKESKSKFIR